MTIAVPRQRLVPIRWGEIQCLPKREPLFEGVLDVGAMSSLVGASGSYKTRRGGGDPLGLCHRTGGCG
jgi:hypothetical protein